MKIALINPNSTASMTDKVRQVAERRAFPGTELWTSNPTDTPASIEGHSDEVLSSPALLAELRKAQTWGAEGYVIACFDDPVLGACRETVTGPVLGLCEAAVRTATVIASRFSIVTTLSRSVPIIEDLVRNYGAEHQCQKVRAAEIPVLALEDDGLVAEQKIDEAIAEAIVEDRCEAVILGCAGMADLTEKLARKHGIPVLDGVVCALKWCEALVAAGLQTSKAGAYAAPRPK
jgi:allantoin racemase